MDGQLKLATRCLISDISDKIGLDIEIVAYRGGYPARTGIGAYVENPDTSTISISYREEDASRDYAVAHEIARIDRFFSASTSERRVMSSSPATRSIGYEQMLREAADVGSGNESHELVSQLYDGLLTQLLSQPADPWINVWLLENCSALRDDIDTVFTEEIRYAQEGLSEQLRSVLPAIAYSASHAMNAATAKFAAEFLGRKALSLPYDESDFSELGSLLSGLNSTDRGHVGDCETSDAWAKALGLAGWYEWKSLR